MASLTTAALISQAANLAAMPWLTRAYGTEAFGTYALLLSWAAIGTAVVGMGLPPAVVADPEDAPAQRAARLAVTLAGLAGVIGAVMLLLGVLDATSLSALAPAGAVMVVTMSGVHIAVIRHVSLRFGRFRSLAVSAVAMTLCMVMVQLALASFSLGYWGLLAGALMGQSLFVALLVRRTDWQGAPGVAGVFRRQHDFIRYRMPQELLAVAAQGLPQVVIGVMYGVSAAGLYALAFRVVAAPGRMLADTMGQVIFARISRIPDAAGLATYLRRWTFVMAGIGTAVFLPLALVSLVIFEPIFGSEWGEAGPVAATLSFWLWCSFVNVPCVRAIPALGLQRFHLRYEVLSTVARVGAIVLAGIVWSGSLLAAVACFSAASGILSLVLVAVVFFRASKAR